MSSHRGRIQVQADGVEFSRSWDRDTPPTASDGLELLEELLASVPQALADDLVEAVVKARGFIERCGTLDGVDHPQGASYRARRSKVQKLRIDIEVNLGRAFTKGDQK